MRVSDCAGSWPGSACYPDPNIATYSSTATGPNHWWLRAPWHSATEYSRFGSAVRADSDPTDATSTSTSTNHWRLRTAGYSIGINTRISGSDNSDPGAANPTNSFSFRLPA
jgi:hypothetical protein